MKFKIILEINLSAQMLCVHAGPYL